MHRAQARGKLGRFAVECNGGPASGLTRDFDVAPAHAVVPSRAESFHASFLGGKAGGVAFHTIGLGVTITDLAFGKHAMEEAVAVAGQGLSDAWNLGDVDAGADNHEPIP